MSSGKRGRDHDDASGVQHASKRTRHHEPASTLSDEAQRRASELERRLAASAAGIAARAASGSHRTALDSAPVLRLDAQGREIDAHGNVIQVSVPTELKVNQRHAQKQQQQQRDGGLQVEAVDVVQEMRGKDWFDNRVGTRGPERKRRSGIQFIAPGSVVAQQEERRRAAAERAKAAAEEAAAKAALEAQRREKSRLVLAKAEAEAARVTLEQAPTPDVEWWDVPLFPAGYPEQQQGDGAGLDALIDDLVERPVSIQPPVPGANASLPLMLTAKERRKLRRRRRLDQETEKQDKIRLGLMEPPPPKLRLSNFMRVIGEDAYQDPTKVEQEVRRQMAARLKKREDENASRKLTKEQRRAKKIRKLTEDTSQRSRVVVYRVDGKDVLTPQRLFKVKKNAEQFMLTGMCVITSAFVLVAVEGGPKNLRRYTALMMRRIDWAGRKASLLAAEADDTPTAAAARGGGGEDSTGAEPEPRCRIVWQGNVAERAFTSFDVHRFASGAFARKQLADHGVPQYWDLAAALGDDDEGLVAEEDAVG